MELIVTQNEKNEKAMNPISITHPELAKEWHPNKNGDSSPDKITSGSNKKAWWICKSGHEWMAIIGNRAKGTGCPFCSGRKATPENSFAKINPSKAQEWNAAKNIGMSPNDFTPSSHKSVWWTCQKNHEWQAKISDRSRGSGCPYCANKKINSSNSLLYAQPELARQWHPTRNGSLTANQVAPKSDLKVWWLCEEGHEFESAVYNRANGKGCPFCSGKRVSSKNSFAIHFPEISRQFHSVLNAPQTVDEFSVGSNKRVWWVCDKGHEWKTSPNKRSSGYGCPYCTGQRPHVTRSLLSTSPEICSEWHPSKNKGLSPAMFSPVSGKKAWWICPKKHEYQALISNRVKGRKCPFCAGKKACDDNCLQTVFPEIAKEWHSGRNGKLTPFNVTPGSNKKAWWICNRKHEWKAVINSRATAGNGCPFCHSQSSRLELRLYTEFEKLFEKVSHRIKLHGKECDIFIPQLKLGVEVDGIYWHKEKVKQDLEKAKNLKSHGISLMRVREKGLPLLSELDVHFSQKEADEKIVGRVFKSIHDKFDLPGNMKEIIAQYVAAEKIINESRFREILNRLPSPDFEKSLASLNSLLSREWHPQKNHGLLPSDVSPGSSLKVWWFCNKDHEWEAIVSDRNRGNGCPYCSNKKINSSNSLLFASPQLSKQWHQILNGAMTPNDVSPHSGKMAWWICDAGHTFESKVSNRATGYGCPFCSGRKDLTLTHPHLISEWHPNLNGPYSPELFTQKSHRNIFWLCQNGHTWNEAIYKRVHGQGCPSCR